MSLYRWNNTRDDTWPCHYSCTIRELFINSLFCRNTECCYRIGFLNLSQILVMFNFVFYRTKCETPLFCFDLPIRTNLVLLKFPGTLERQNVKILLPRPNEPLVFLLINLRRTQQTIRGHLHLPPPWRLGEIIPKIPRVRSIVLIFGNGDTNGRHDSCHAQVGTSPRSEDWTGGLRNSVVEVLRRRLGWSSG